MKMDLKMTPDWNPRRAKKTLDFVLSCGITRGVVLDIGEPNDLGKYLEMHTGCKLVNTHSDLDYTIEVDRKYDTVFCFEVIEHLFNPLNCLLEMKKVLAPEGRIYLSTPRFKPHFLWGDHFHEMSDKSLFALLERAGLEVVRRKKIYIAPWRGLVQGLRPWLRLLFDRVWLFELK